MNTATLLRFDRSHGRRLGSETVYESAADYARAVAPESPVFCFSPDALTRQAHKFLAGFPGETSYAVKSNSSPEVIRVLARAGIAVWDVASVAEMDLVAANAPRPVFHYHNPVKSRDEIKQAYTRHQCRRFATDCVEELEKVADCLPSDRGSVEIAVRFVLPRLSLSTAHDFSSKFGAKETEAAALLARASALGFRTALTFHPGSQCKDAGAYARHIEAAARIARTAQVNVDVLNVGGGFPARYVLSEGPDLSLFFSAISASVAASFGESNLPKLECEPGRGMVANCMSVLARVKLFREGTNELFLNDGVYGALMEVSQVPELQPPHRVIREGKPLNGDRLVTVYGPTCDPLDKLPSQIAVPSDIREGDFVEFGCLGAYGSATMTRFNGYGGHQTIRVKKVLAL